MKNKYIIFILLVFLFIFILCNTPLLKENKEIFINNTTNFEKIYIFQGDLTDGDTNGNKGKIEFMYKPIVISIKKLLNETYPSIPIIFEVYENKPELYSFNHVTSNDIFIYVGEHNSTNINFKDLKNRNIYTIYYNSEPKLIDMDSHEIWTYSKYIFDKYEKNDNQLIKYVPIVCEDTNTFIDYKNTNINDIKLCFMGYTGNRQDKYSTLTQNVVLKDKIFSVYNIWNDNEYNNFMSEIPAKIFVNITQNYSVVPNIFPSVRINKLLSHKCIVISENTNEIDEEKYKGIVYFADINEIGNVFSMLINKTNEELQQESEIRYQKFKEIFDCKNALKLITVK